MPGGVAGFHFGCKGGAIPNTAEHNGGRTSGRILTTLNWTNKGHLLSKCLTLIFQFVHCILVLTSFALWHTSREVETFSMASNWVLKPTGFSTTSWPKFWCQEHIQMRLKGDCNTAMCILYSFMTLFVLCLTHPTEVDGKLLPHHQRWMTVMLLNKLLADQQWQCNTSSRWWETKLASFQSRTKSATCRWISSTKQTRSPIHGETANIAAKQGGVPGTKWCSICERKPCSTEGSASHNLSLSPLSPFPTSLHM